MVRSRSIYSYSGDWSSYRGTPGQGTFVSWGDHHTASQLSRENPETIFLVYNKGDWTSAWSKGHLLSTPEHHNG